MGVTVPGCAVGDDFTRALGDPAEGRLAAALEYRRSAGCPAVAAAEAAGRPASLDGVTPKPPWRENRLLRRRDR